MKVEHRPATLEDVDALLRAGVREDEAVEFRRLGLDPETALRRGLDAFSVATYAGPDILALWGVYPVSLLTDTGRIWLVGSPFIDKHWLTFARESRRVFPFVSAAYPRLENHVDASNKRTRAWLSWLGFRFDEEPVLSPFGFPFVRFWR